MNAKRTVIFDLDGTLVDSRSGIEWALRMAAREALHREIEEDTTPLIGRRVVEICDRLYPEVSVSARESFVASFRHHYDAEGWKHARPFPNCLETLRRMSADSYSLHLVTNKPEGPTELILAATGLEELLETYICADSLDGFDRKSSALKYSATRLGMDYGNDLVYVGDTVEDLEAARACGLRFKGVAYGYGATELSEMVESLVPSISQLPASLG